MIRRAKLGNTYTKSPADNTKAWFAVNLSKIVFALFISLCYMGVLWVIMKIIIFLGMNVAEVWEDVDVNDVYAGPYGLFFKVVGVIAIMFYVFQDKPRKRK